MPTIANIRELIYQWECDAKANRYSANLIISTAQIDRTITALKILELAYVHGVIGSAQQEVTA